MQDLKSIKNTMVTDMITDINIALNYNAELGPHIYRKYCKTCYTIFNFFEFLEKHHHSLRTISKFRELYTILGDKINQFIESIENNNNICTCDTGEHMVPVEDIDGNIINQYSIWDNPMFLHFDYLEFDPLGLWNTKGPADENITMHVVARIAELETEEFERRYNDQDYDDHYEDDDDRFITIDEANIEEPIFVLDEDIPNIQAPSNTDEPRTYLYNSDDEPEEQNTARRLDFTDIDVPPPIPIADDISQWIREHYNDLNTIEGYIITNPPRHPILIRLIREGQKPLPTITTTNVYDKEYRRNYRLSQKNFLIKTYISQEDSRSGITSIRVHRDMSAVVNELKIWLKYFEKPHQTLITTTIFSLRNKINDDCIYNIAQFI